MSQPPEAKLLDVIELQTAIAAGGRSPEAVMQLACDRAAAITGANGAVVALAEGEEMVHRVVSGILSRHAGLRLGIESSLSGAAVRSGDVMRCDDSEQDERVDREACRRVSARSMLCVPLNHDGRCLGVLKVASSRAAAFDETDVAVLRMLNGVIAAAMTQADLIRRLREESRQDALTGLANRRRWDEEITSRIARARRDRGALALCLIDVDGFKQVNDTHGHAAGDQLLQELATTLRSAVRADEFIARLGGDEFAILLHAASPRPVDALVQRLRSALRRGRSVSVGVAFLRNGDTPATMLERADAAMYAEKGRRPQRVAALLQTQPAG